MLERDPLPRKRLLLTTRQKSQKAFAVVAKLFANALLFSLFAIPTAAQFQSAFVFASDPKGVAVYTRNDATGVLTPVPGSPFPSKEAVTSMVMDFKGRYLFSFSELCDVSRSGTKNPHLAKVEPYLATETR